MGDSFGFLNSGIVPCFFGGHVFLPSLSRGFPTVEGHTYRRLALWEFWKCAFVLQQECSLVKVSRVGHSDEKERGKWMIYF